MPYKIDDFNDDGGFGTNVLNAINYEREKYTFDYNDVEIRITGGYVRFYVPFIDINGRRNKRRFTYTKYGNDIRRYTTEPSIPITKRA